jgi:hypothetical protein
MAPMVVGDSARRTRTDDACSIEMFTELFIELSGDRNPLQTAVVWRDPSVGP